MVTDLDSFSRLVTAIYGTVTQPKLWNECLTEIGQAFDATGAALIASRPGSQRTVIAASVPPGARESYQNYYCDIDYVLGALEAAPVGIIQPGSAVIDPAAQTEFNVDFMRPHHMDDGIFVRLNNGGRTTSFLIVAPRQSALFCAGERLRLANALLPHLQQTLRIQRQVAAYDADVHDLEGVVDTITPAVLILTRTLGITRTNPAAEQILSDADGLSGSRHVLDAAYAPTRTTLRSAVAAVTRPDGVPAQARTFTCARPSGKQPYVIHVLPSRPTEGDAERRALVFVIDPARGPVPAHQTLRVLYGLTDAEARIALHALRGEGLTAVVTELGLSVATVKTHLQHVFAKTGTHRQAELVRLLAQILP
ncbi:hypothetical protein A5768_25950 [Mycolicibacterium fortuitum]|uniref:helix-turn-helix transcriptional regulator n=1 Tax=Mycolicibacterium fortuitum TaxID=1766 RepID=UPI0007EA0A76|nr:helix-turn-helix transcriptional regulator [Mycolicibacterium fortuitum]OBG21551.1 hypothetical protein A5768_25950 [Mycolicibacterium fortuitum]